MSSEWYRNFTQGRGFIFNFFFQITEIKRDLTEQDLEYLGKNAKQRGKMEEKGYKMEI